MWIQSSCMVVRENAGESVDSARLLRAGRCGEAAAGGVRGFPASPLARPIEAGKGADPEHGAEADAADGVILAASRVLLAAGLLLGIG